MCSVVSKKKIIGIKNLEVHNVMLFKKANSFFLVVNSILISDFIRKPANLGHTV